MSKQALTATVNGQMQYLQALVEDDQEQIHAFWNPNITNAKSLDAEQVAAVAEIVPYLEAVGVSAPIFVNLPDEHKQEPYELAKVAT